MDNNSDVIYRMLVQSVIDYAIAMLKPDGTVASWNEGGLNVLGYRPEEIMGQHAAVFYNEEDRRRGLPQRELDIAATVGRYDYEGWRCRKDGSTFWAHVVI